MQPAHNTKAADVSVETPILTDCGSPTYSDCFDGWKT